MFRGEVEWSPKYKLTKNVKRLWDQLRKYRKGKVTSKRISLTSIRRLMRQTKLHKALESTMGEIEVKLREAKKDFRDIKKKCQRITYGSHNIAGQGTCSGKGYYGGDQKEAEKPYCNTTGNGEGDSTGKKKRVQTNYETIPYYNSRKNRMYDAKRHGHSMYHRK